MDEKMAGALELTNFGVVDWVIVGIYLLISVFIGSLMVATIGDHDESRVNDR